MSEEKAPLTVFEIWFNDWMELHPPADRYSFNDRFTTIEIMHAYFLETMDEGAIQELIQNLLIDAGYQFEGGAWLTL